MHVRTPFSADLRKLLLLKKSKAFVGSVFCRHLFRVLTILFKENETFTPVGAILGNILPTLRARPINHKLCHYATVGK